MKKTNKSVPIKKTDFLVNKSMGVFALAILGILGLVCVSRAAATASGYVVILNISWAVLALGVVLLIGAVYWALRDRKTESVPPYRYFSGLDLGVIAALLIFSAALYRVFDVLSVTRLLYVVFPACAVLYLLFSLLQRIFFMQALLCGSSMILMWIVARAGSTTAIVFSVLGIVLAAAFAAFFAILKAGDGAIRIASHTFHSVERGEEYGVAFLSVAVTALLFVAGIVFASASIVGAGSVLLYILCGYLFILAVYYTVKLM
ncbi:MAG: hypothetical protein VB111_03830 [Clostridiaceae bacterium]|nr:hypothetical protein [Clostridiaceae bacterium]